MRQFPTLSLSKLCIYISLILKMMQDLFNEEGEEDYCVLSTEQAKTSSLAGEMETPIPPKAPSGFVGLLNQ